MEVLLLFALTVIGGAAVGVASFGKQSPARPVPLGVVAAAAPSFLMMVLFYSLAWRMHHHLGGWPNDNGEQSLPQALLVHAKVAHVYFSTLLVITLIVWPLAFVPCWLVDAWRRWAAYLGLHAFSFLVCIATMLLAPAPYLSWWYD